MLLDLSLRELSCLREEAKNNPQTLSDIYARLMEIKLLTEELLSIADESMYEEIPYPGMKQ